MQNSVSGLEDRLLLNDRGDEEKKRLEEIIRNTGWVINSG